MNNDAIIKKIIKYPINVFKNLILDFRSTYYLSNVNKKKKSTKIRVGFVVQMSELWAKQSSVYIKMAEDDSFEVSMIIVPAYDFKNNCVGNYGEEKDYFISNCINGNYVLARDKDKFADISSLGIDYLFYQRPYDTYLPDTLKSNNMVKYSKLCYIPYATPEIKKTTIYPKNFFRNLSFGFMEDRGAAKINTKAMYKNCRKGIQHFLNIGYPTFEKCLSLNKKCNYKKFLWAPRWSYAPIEGGSHFMEYNQLLTNHKWGDSSLLVRPHPLMWDNFVKTGILKEDQIVQIKEQWELHNISIDQNVNIEDTFDETDIMIADRSSVIPMFFLTGKPIIYCPIECEYGSLFNALLPGLYIANNWNELEKYILMLSKQEDPLLVIRKKIIAKYFSSNKKATENIVNAIKKDYNKS